MSDAPPPPPPPPPPPAPPAPGQPLPKKPTGLAYLGAIVLLAIAVAPQLMFEASDPALDGPPYRIGRMLGAAVFGLLIGWVIWWIARKTRPKGALPRFSPWVLVIAAGVALLSALPSLMQRNLTEAAEESQPAYEGPAELDARQVVEGIQPAGAVVVFLMATPPDAWEESRAGFIRGVEESGVYRASTAQSPRPS